MAIAQGTGGPQVVSDGAVPAAGMRVGRQGDQIVSELQGRYFEQTVRGNVYSLILTATTGTIAAGNIDAAAAAASTQFALWNPPSSKVNLELLKVWIVPISGTAPGGGCWHNFMLQGVPTIQPVGQAYNMLVGGPGPTARYVASAGGVALTGAGAITPAKGMAMNLFAAALSATTYIQPTLEEINGDIVLPPGTGWVPCFAGAGTTFISGYGVEWAEVPI
jgi:hypothetical protein